MNAQKIKDFFQSKLFKKILMGLGCFILIFLIFQAGMFVGYKRAGFSYKFGENYHKMFGGPPPSQMFPVKMFPKDLRRGNFMDSHGTIGKIIKINLPTFVIEDSYKVEKVVLIKEDTTIMHLREAIKATDLKVDDSVVIIGAPNDQAQIEAKLIRIAPAPAPIPPTPPQNILK